MTWIFIWNTAPTKIFVWWQQVSKVFAWDTQIRPTSWPTTTYYINLAWSSAADVLSAWWSFNGNNTPSFDSVWAYTSWKMSIVKYFSSLSGISNIKITSNYRAVTGYWNWDIYAWALWRQNDPNHTIYDWYQWKMQTYNSGNWKWIMISIYDGQKNRNGVTTPTWDYKWVVEVDLVTWVMTYTLSWDASWSVSYTMSPWELSAITTDGYTYIWAWFEAASSWAGANGHKLKDIQIDLS